MTPVAAVFLFGFEAVLAQVLLLREFLVIVGGNELVLGLFYGVWFLGIAGGAMAARWVQPGPMRLAAVTATVFFLQALGLAGGILVVRVWRSVCGISPGVLMPLEGILWALGCTVFPFSACTGYLFPLLCRNWGRGKSDERRAVGTVYALEAVGSLAAGIVVALYLVGRATPLTSATRAAALVALAGAFLLRREQKILQAAGIVAFVGLAILPSLGVFERLRDFSVGVRWQSLAGSMTHVDSLQTPYQQIDLGVLEDQYSLLLDGRFAESFPDPYAAAAEAHLVMAQAPGVRRVLLLGGGLTGTAAELLRYPGVRVEAVEIDPEVMRVARPYLSSQVGDALRDPRLTVRWTDARRALREAAVSIARGEVPPFDLVVALVPDPTNAALNRFYTREFFLEAASALRAEGTLVLTSGSAVNYFGPEIRRFTGSVYRTLRSVFPCLVATPGEKTYLFASRSADVVTSDPAVLARRFLDAGINAPQFQPEYYSMVLEPWHTDLTNRSLAEAAEAAPLNTDLNPVTYELGLRLWARFSDSPLAGVLGWIETIRPAEVFAVAGFLMLLRIGYAYFGRRRGARIVSGNLLVVLVLTGACGMSVSLIILFSFQNGFGTLYREVGALIGLFMAGLALGGFAFRRPVRKRVFGVVNRSGNTEADEVVISLSRVRTWQVVFAVGIAAMALALWMVASAPIQHAPTSAAIGFLLYSMMFLGGLLTGAEFPLAGHVQAALGVDLPRRSAWLESADHLGAAAGALLTGILLVPRLGLVGTLVLLACLKMGTALLLSVPIPLPRRTGPAIPSNS